MCHEMDELSVKFIYEAKQCVAEPRCTLRDHIEHRLDSARRAADNVEYVAGGNLVLQRLGQLARLCLLGLEQPDVLDRDHRLVGKRCYKLDVLVVEWVHNGPAQQDHTNRVAPRQQRYAEIGSKAAYLLYFA